MSTFEIKGKLVVIEDTVKISETFKKREFVIEVENEKNSDWNDFIKFQLTQDKCSLVDSMKVGDDVNASFNVRGRKWEKDGKVNYFNSLECWKLDPVKYEPTTTATIEDLKPADESDKLPF